MALKGKPPETVQKRLKALFFGVAGVGKTMASIQFPRPYLIDTERGAENDQYVSALRAAHGAYLFTTNPDELIEEVRQLLGTPHEFRTLVIDPLTTVYNDLVDKYAQSEGTEFGRHKIPADRKIKHLLNLLVRLPMNVIITSHSKPRWLRTKDAAGKDTVVEDGQTFDCYTRLDYIFDLVLEVQRRGKERVGVVRKSRIAAFAEGDVFPFTYETVANLYGRATLEANAVPEVLADDKQIAELTRLVGVLNIPSNDTDRWLDKAKAETFAELPATIAEKCIAWCKAKVHEAAQAENGVTA